MGWELWDSSRTPHLMGVREIQMSKGRTKKKRRRAKKLPDLESTPTVHLPNAIDINYRIEHRITLNHKQRWTLNQVVCSAVHQSPNANTRHGPPHSPPPHHTPPQAVDRTRSNRHCTGSLPPGRCNNYLMPWLWP